MAVRSFIDTNVLIYAEASDVPVKQRAALSILKKLYEDANGVLSTQVLQEYCNVALKKLRLPFQHVRDQLDWYKQKWCRSHPSSSEPVWICTKRTVSRFMTRSFWPVHKHRVAWCCSAKT